MKLRQRGFTLLEIMIVMVVLSYGLVAVVAAAAQSARTTSTIQELEMLRQAAEQVVATEVIMGEMRFGRTEGQTGSVNWTLEVGDDPEFVNLKTIIVTTYIKDRPAGRKFKLETRQAQLGSLGEGAL